MNNFTQRTLSAAVYAAVVISSILVHPAYFGLVFIIITMLAIREYHGLMHSNRITTILSSLLGGVLFLIGWMLNASGNIISVSMSSVWVLVAVYMMLLVATLILELFLKAENPITNWGHILVSQVMIALPFMLMNGILSENKYLLLALFIAIWVNDTGAYIVGSLLGKRKAGNHKMFPRVSPAKSWEGLIGGYIFTLIAGYVFYRVGWVESIWMSLILSLAISTFGTLGDLMESLMKRTIGVKDSGRFMPGHGGVLDRFDSLLLATPIVYLILSF